MFGKLSLSAIPFENPIIMGAVGGAIPAGHGDPGPDHLLPEVDLPLEGVADQPRPQKNRHHVYYPGPDHAAARVLRCHPDALSAGPGRGRVARLSAARTLRPDIQRPRHDHDRLHGHAVSGRIDQYRRAAANRRARCGLSLYECGQPLADRSRGLAGDGIAGGGRIFQGRLVRVCTPGRNGNTAPAQGWTIGCGLSRSPVSAR